MAERHQVLELMCETCGAKTAHLQVPNTGWACVGCEARRRATGEVAAQAAPPPPVAAPPAEPVVLELDCGACGKKTLHQRRPDTGAMVCVACRVRAEAVAHMPLPPPSAASTGGMLPVVLIGGVLAAVSVFLPWISVGALSRNGMELTHEDALVVLGSGILAALLGLDRRTGIVGRLGAVIFGLVVVAIGLHDFGQIQDRVASLDGTMLAGAGSVGVGLYAAIGGGGLITLGGLLKR